MPRSVSVLPSGDADGNPRRATGAREIGVLEVGVPDVGVLEVGVPEVGYCRVSAGFADNQVYVSEGHWCGHG